MNQPNEPFRPSIKGHSTRCLVETQSSRIDECSCGTLHIRIRNVHLKMPPAEFVHFAAAVGMAGEPYLEQISHRAN